MGYWEDIVVQLGVDSLVSCCPRGEIKIIATNTNQNRRLGPGGKIHEAIQQIPTFVSRLGGDDWCWSNVR